MQRSLRKRTRSAEVVARLDDPLGVQKFEGAYFGGKALLVLGGPSAQNWREVQAKVKPDVVLGANGTIFDIDNLDFHLVTENMHLAARKASEGDPRSQRMMKIISPDYVAKVRMISYLNWKMPVVVDSRLEAIKIKRMGELGDDYETQFARFSFHHYGDGFLSGPLFDHPGALTSPKIKFRVGTVGTQLLHLAGILGVSEIHTIGFDLCFRESSQHHWYNYPKYQPDKFRTYAMFTDFAGLQTQWDWVQGARWLKKTVKPMMVKEGIQWIDHSNGLLEMIPDEVQMRA